MEDLDELADEVGEERVRRVLLSVDARRALREFTRDCAVRFAEQLWRQRVLRKAVVERLQQRYEFKERKAYMIADEGLERFAKSRDAFAKPAGTIESGSKEADSNG